MAKNDKQAKPYTHTQKEETRKDLSKIRFFFAIDDLLDNMRMVFFFARRNIISRDVEEIFLFFLIHSFLCIILK
jgi:hypothetical protein